MKAFQASRSFAKLIDFHSYSREVRRNYGPCAPLPENMVQVFTEAASQIADSIKYKQSQSCCMGGDIHYAFNQHGTLAFLVETGNAFQPPPSEMKAELRQVFPGILKLLELEPSLTGRIRDRDTKKGIAGATISVLNMNLKLKERTTATRFGLYHMWLPKGEWHVLVSAPGYAKRKAKLIVKDGHKGTRDILLSKPTAQQ